MASNLTKLLPALLLLAACGPSNHSDRARAAAAAATVAPNYSQLHLGTPRSHHTATPLLDGKIILVAGLGAQDTPLASTTVLTRDTATPGPTLQTPRHGHTATLLPSNQVLVAGGLDAEGQPLASVELIDLDQPSASSFGQLHHARAHHTAYPLDTPQGPRVLLIGGSHDSAELFDPATQHSTPLTLSAHLPHAHAAPLAGNRLLITSDADAALFCVDSLTFHPLSNVLPRQGAALASRGFDALLAGGAAAALEDSSEVLDATSLTFSQGPRLTSPRKNATATTLVDRIAVIGGCDADGNPSAEIDRFSGDDLLQAHVTPLPPLYTARQFHTATALDPHTLIVAGGRDAQNNPLATAEIVPVPERTTEAVRAPRTNSRPINRGTYGQTPNLAQAPNLTNNPLATPTPGSTPSTPGSTPGFNPTTFTPNTAANPVPNPATPSGSAGGGNNLLNNVVGGALNGLVGSALGGGGGNPLGGILGGALGGAASGLLGGGGNPLGGLLGGAIGGALGGGSNPLGGLLGGALGGGNPLGGALGGGSSSGNPLGNLLGGAAGGAVNGLLGGGGSSGGNPLNAALNGAANGLLGSAFGANTGGGNNPLGNALGGAITGALTGGNTGGNTPAPNAGATNGTPSLISVSQLGGSPGMVIRITAQNLGSTASITVNNVPAPIVNTATNGNLTTLSFTVPATATTGPLNLTSNGTTLNAGTFTVR